MATKDGPRSANPVDTHVGSRIRVRRQVLKMSQENAPEFAEGDQTPIVYDFIKSSDGVALATAVSQIKNKAVRRQILELARSLAKDEDDS